jgi:hypothetical protein
MNLIKNASAIAQYLMLRWPELLIIGTIPGVKFGRPVVK